MTWKKAHKMNNFEKIIAKFEKDGNTKKAEALKFVLNEPAKLLICILTLKEEKTLDMCATELAQYISKQPCFEKLKG